MQGRPNVIIAPYGRTASEWCKGCCWYEDRDIYGSVLNEIFDFNYCYHTGCWRRKINKKTGKMTHERISDYDIGIALD
jgi:hypothetical protein